MYSSSSPERWERSLAGSTNNGDEVRRRSQPRPGLWSPTICSSSLSRFLTDSETSSPSLRWSLQAKYPASRHLVGRTSWRGGLGLSYCGPVCRQGVQWSIFLVFLWIFFARNHIEGHRSLHLVFRTIFTTLRTLFKSVLCATQLCIRSDTAS